MNIIFLPSSREQELINNIQKYYREDYALIRLTPTMIKKSIIDASYEFRYLLESNKIVEYSKLDSKIYKDVHILLDGKIKKLKTSFYTANTRKDPRFCIYGISKYVEANTLIYFTIKEEKIIAIPLINNEIEDNKDIIIDLFDVDNDENIVQELIDKLIDIHNKGWIESVSPAKLNPKDSGDTFERELGIKANSLISADYKGKIELKTKLKTSTTKHTLFSMVPEWNESNVSSSTEMILDYGYPTRKPEKYPNFIDLYVTVSNNPNNQGLYLEVDYKKERLLQKYKDSKTNKEKELCVWKFEDIKKRLNEKHPKTMWAIAEMKKIEDRIYFRYSKVEMTQNPIFMEFLNLIELGMVTYDWRGRVRADGTGYKDKGHCFRINPSSRDILFGETRVINLDE